MKVVLTSDQAKDARSRLGLSQGKVASELGINRTYLSLFEGGKYVFEDATLSALREYYEQEGAVFEEPATQETSDGRQTIKSGGVRCVDGFQVPSAMDPEAADQVLTEYAENRTKLAELFAQRPREGFLLFGVDDDDRRERQESIMLLMARNYALIEQLHGHQPFGDLPSIGDADDENPTMGERLRGLFSEKFDTAAQAALTEEDG